MCGRVICALTSDELLDISKAKEMKNSMKYKKSYNIGPERYLPGILQKNYLNKRKSFSQKLKNSETISNTDLKEDENTNTEKTKISMINESSIENHNDSFNDLNQESK